MSSATPAVSVTFAGAIAFEVLGEPVPQGSKQAFVVGKRAVVTDRGSARLGPWRQQVNEAARAVILEPLAGEVFVVLRFCLARPKSHYRMGAHAGELKPTAPKWVSTRPDIDKLARAVLDGLTGSAFRDDGQVAELVASKSFGTRPGVMVTVCPLVGEP